MKVTKTVEKICQDVEVLYVVCDCCGVKIGEYDNYFDASYEYLLNGEQVMYSFDLCHACLDGGIGGKVNVRVGREFI